MRYHDWTFVRTGAPVCEKCGHVRHRTQSIMVPGRVYFERTTKGGLQTADPAHDGLCQAVT